MKLNIPLLKRGIHRLYSGKAIDIKSLATKSWTLCPEEHTTVPAAIYLEGAINKIEGLSPWRNWETEISSILGGTAHHMASTAHVVENVDLVNAYLYSGPAKHNPGWGDQKVFLDNQHRSTKYNDANLITSNSGSHFFGTFLLDDFPLSLVPQEDDFNISMVSKTYKHAAQYQTLFNIPKQMLVQFAHIDRLTIYTDFAQNSFKELRYRKLRLTVRENLAGFPRKPSTGVYLKRGSTGEPRILENEEDVISLLENLGFDIIEPDILSAMEIAQRTLDARIIISVEGSHLSHVIYTVEEGGTFLVLQPPNRFALAYKEFTDRMDMVFAFLVGSKSANGFNICTDDLLTILDRLDWT